MCYQAASPAPSGPTAETLFPAVLLAAGPPRPPPRAPPSSPAARSGSRPTNLAAYLCVSSMRGAISGTTKSQTQRLPPRHSRAKALTSRLRNPPAAPPIVRNSRHQRRAPSNSRLAPTSRDTSCSLRTAPISSAGLQACFEGDGRRLSRNAMTPMDTPPAPAAPRAGRGIAASTMPR